MKANHTHPYFDWGVGLLIFLYFYLGSFMLFHLKDWRLQLWNAPILDLGSTAVEALTWFIPTLLLFTGGALAFFRTQRIGLYVSLGLLTIYTSYVAVRLFHTVPNSCSCGGGWITLSLPWQLGMGLLSIGLTFTLLLQRKKI